MPAFSYQALKADGHTDRGVLQADTVRGARQLLRERGLVPVSVDEVAAQSDAGAVRLARRAQRRPPRAAAARAGHPARGRPAD